MKPRSRYYTIGIVALSILFLIGGYYVTIRTLWSKAASVATYKNEIISANYIKQFAQIMFNSFEGSKEDISLLQTLFIQKQGEVDFIEYIEQLARSQGLEVAMDTVSVDSPKHISAYGMEYLVLNFNVKGSWSRVFNFSRMLQVLPYASSLQDMNMIREGEVGEAGKPQSGVWKGVYTIKVLKKK